MNDVCRLNKFFEAAHKKLVNGGHFIVCLETLSQRRARIVSKYPLAVSAPYFLVNFMLKRLMPKLPLTKQLYFGITKGRDRLLSRAEALGRLYSCGFEVLDLKHIDHLLFVVARKVKPPAYDPDPSYGPVFKMKRVGFQGKPIHVYKMRTMYKHCSRPLARQVRRYGASSSSYREI